MFDSPPLVTVFYGPNDIGAVHPISFADHDTEPVVLSLAGRSWKVIHFDQDRGVANVQPTDEPGRSLWMGGSQPLSYDYCQSVRRILLADDVDHRWSRRAVVEITRAREECTTVTEEGTVVGVDADRARTVWWTFAGVLANAWLARVAPGGRADNYAVVWPCSFRLSELEVALKALHTLPPTWEAGAPDSARLKFSDCLPDDLRSDLFRSRNFDSRAADTIRQQPLNSNRV